MLLNHILYCFCLKAALTSSEVQTLQELPLYFSLLDAVSEHEICVTCTYTGRDFNRGGERIMHRASCSSPCCSRLVKASVKCWMEIWMLWKCSFLVCFPDTIILNFLETCSVCPDSRISKNDWLILLLKTMPKRKKLLSLLCVRFFSLPPMCFC